MDKPGYLYILKNPSFEEHVYKLGLTKNPKQRLRSYVTCYVDKSDYMYVSCLFHDCSKAEQTLFYLLRAYRMRDKREFFKLPLEDIKQQIQKLEKLSMDELNDLHRECLHPYENYQYREDREDREDDDDPFTSFTNFLPVTDFLNSFKFNPGLSEVVAKMRKL